MNLSKPWLAVLLFAASSAVVSSAFASPAFAAAAEPTARPSSSEDDWDSAFGAFKAAAARLGKSMAKTADNDTAKTRKKIMKTMNRAILQLGHTMDRASEKLESPKPDKPESK